MLGRIQFVLCAYATVAFAAAFVGAALGIAASRAFRGERGSSPLLVLLCLAAVVGFMSVLFLTYFGAFDRPVISGGLKLVMGLLVMGMAVATPPVVRWNQAAVALIAAAAGMFLTLVLTVIALTLMPTLRQPSTPYLVGTFVPPMIGLFFGWVLSWQRDLDAMLDGELDQARRAQPI